MTILWSNNASSTVAGAITATDTTVALQAGTGVEFPNPTGGNYFIATFYDQATKTVNEIVHVTARSGDVCTIVRAQEGTVAGNWNEGDIFANLVTAGTLEAFVQAGVGPADTSLVYVGTDVGTVNHIVAATNPIPSNLAVGMLFNIQILNTCTGPTDMSLNGLIAHPVYRQNGAAIVGNDFTAGQEMLFICNSTGGPTPTFFFNAMIPDVKQHPPQQVFYVRTDGNDGNSGLANDPADAFATLYGAVNAIQSRYISQLAITIRIADGVYSGGCSFQGGYISQWNVIGNTSNPGAVIIDATSATPPNFPPASLTDGCGILAYQGANVIVQGIKVQSYASNFLSEQSSYINCIGCIATSPTSGSGAPWAVSSGNMSIDGNCTFDPQSRNCFALFLAQGGGGNIGFGYKDIFSETDSNISILTATTVVQGCAVGMSGGVVGPPSSVATITGTVHGPKWFASTAGGVGNPNWFPGDQAGVTMSPGWTS